MIVFSEKLAGLGELVVIPLHPSAHAEVVHGWVTRPGNQHWGMADYTVAQVQEVYAFVDSLETHHAYLLMLDDGPIGIFQTYQPEHDPVGKCYEVQPGDIGVHLLLDAGDRVLPHLTSAIFPALLRHVFADPAHQRIVAEPDIRNERMITRLQREGFILGEQIDLEHKRAQMAFLTRPHGE